MNWRFAVLFGALLAGCATPQPEGPSEPAPEPPAMAADAASDRTWLWACADDTRLTTRYAEDRDELELELAGGSHVLVRRQRAPTAVWAAGDITFSMTETGDAVVRWQNDEVQCERDMP